MWYRIYVQQPLVAAFRIKIHGQSSSGSQSNPQESASAKLDSNPGVLLSAFGENYRALKLTQVQTKPGMRTTNAAKNQQGSRNPWDLPQTFTYLF